MRRREVIKLLAGAAIWPGTVSAQQQGRALPRRLSLGQPNSHA